MNELNVPVLLIISIVGTLAIAALIFFLIYKILAPFFLFDTLIICFKFFRGFHADPRKLLIPICPNKTILRFLAHQLYNSGWHKVVVQNWNESFL